MTGFRVLDLAADSESSSATSAPRESGALEVDLGVPGVDVDPLGLLTTAGLGWLVEHVDFLREPLDWLAEHGDRFDDAVATWKQVATALGGIARRRAGGSRLAGEMAAMSLVCVGVASHVAAAGAITAAIQGVFRDLIATFVGEVMRNATIALAAAEISAGTSLSAFAAWAVERGAVVLDRITRQLVKLVGVMVWILNVLKALFGKACDRLKAITRFGEGSGTQPVRPTFQRRTGYLDE